MAGICIDLYALCWNEARLLPFFFQHYDSIVNRYFIFDHNSTDRSVELLRLHPRVSLGSFTVSGPSFVQAAADFYNRCWKRSRGQADWVIICNIDEHLQHADLRGYLLKSTQQGLSLIRPVGYQMVSAAFPTSGYRLCDQVREGVRWPIMDKPEVFSPNLIDEMNFTVGRHGVRPTGVVREPTRRAVRLLHYKYLGLNYFIPRNSELGQGLRSEDIAQGWGTDYLWDHARKAADFAQMLQLARPVPVDRPVGVAEYSTGQSIWSQWGRRLARRCLPQTWSRPRNAA